MQERPSYNVSLHLGASSLSMLITESIDERETDIEYVEQPVPIARDIYRSGCVRRNTVDQVIEILENFLNTLKEFGLTPADISLAAITNIVSESSNYHLILHRLCIATQIPFKLLDNGDMTRLLFQKIKCKKGQDFGIHNGNTLAIHAGPGQTRVIYIEQGNAIQYRTYELGTHRTSELLKHYKRAPREYLQEIRRHSAPQIHKMRSDFCKVKIDRVILIGYEVQQVSRLLGDQSGFEQSIKKYDDFMILCNELSIEDRIARFNLDLHTDTAFLPAIQINYNILHAFEVEKYWIPTSNFEKGLLRNLAVTPITSVPLEKETLQAATLFAEKFEVDIPHYEQVLKLTVSLFNQTQFLHGLGKWEFLLLKIAAIIHEIGSYVNPDQFHKHSYYLIVHSSVFGLDKATLKIIALTVQYHTSESPSLKDPNYAELSVDHQILVSKLAALLKIGNALDDSQNQTIESVSVTLLKNRLQLDVQSSGIIEREELILSKRDHLFVQLYGLDVTLVRNSSSKS